MNKNIFEVENGNITYWGLDTIRLDISTNAQLQELKEDLAQINFNNGRSVDIGWYPEFSSAGQFLIHVINDGEWDFPVIQIKFSQIEMLVPVINFAILVAKGNIVNTVIPSETHEE